MAVAFAHGVQQQVAIACYEGATPTAPAAPTIEVSVDGAAFAAADNAAAYDPGTAPDGYVIEGACVFVTLSAAEMTSAVVVVRVTDTNLTEAQYSSPYYPGGHYTAARGEALDNLDAAVTSRAAAGAQMDLVDAPNATAVTAIQSGLAPANEYDVEMARIDDAVSSRAQAGDAMTLTAAYDAAKAAAQAGEAAAAIAAYGPLTAADVEQAPPNMSLLDITPLGEVNVGAVAGTAVTGPDDLKADVSNLDATVSSRSSHSAADVASAVWAAGTRTLTGFGTLVADIATAVWGAAARTLTAFGFTAAANVTQVAGEAVNGVDDFKADVGELALEETLTSMQGATFDTSTDSLEAIRNRGDAAWITGGGSGTGSRTIVFTLSDGAGTLAGSLKTQVEDSEGNLVAGPLATDSSGVVTYYLDDGSYELVSASSPYWRGNSESVTVSASAAVAVTLTAQSLPVPSAANKYTVIIDCADEYGDLVGASAWAIKVLNVLPRGLSTANLVQLTEQNAITTDANGRASFEIAQETTSLTVSITPTLADATTGAPVPFTVEVSADDADESGIIYFADLLHR